MKNLILYVFHNINDNVINFIKYAIFDHKEYKFIIIVNSLDIDLSILNIPSYVEIIIRQNIGYDFAGWNQGLLDNERYKSFDKFLFINSSVAGPFINPIYIGPWPSLFLSKLNDQVKIFSCTINNHDEYGRSDVFTHHCQSFCFALDRISLDICFENDIFKTKDSFINTVVNCELKMSKVILENGYNIGCRMKRYDNLDFRKSNNYPRELFIGDCMCCNSYSDNNLHPLETIFIKTNRNIPYHIYSDYILKTPLIYPLNKKINEMSKDIVLSMMVKNEESDCCKTLKPYIESGYVNFFIYDTGSTDNTVEITREFLLKYDVNFIIKEDQFIDFASSRNKCLDLTKELFPQCRFNLHTDCSWDIVNPHKIIEFCSTITDPDEAYAIYISTGAFYTQKRLFNNKGNARYCGVVHEVVVSSGNTALPKDIYFIWNQSVQSTEKTRKRWYKDLALLLEEHHKNPEDPRTCFYLAQTNDCLGEFDLAVKWYKKRSEMTNGFDEEQFMALYRLGKVHQGKMDEYKSNGNKLEEKKYHDKAVQFFLDAYKLRPKRVEPLIRLALMELDPHFKYIYAHQACLAPFPDDYLFIDKELYDFNRWDQLAIGCWYMKQYTEGYDALLKAMKVYPDLPHIKRNYQLYREKLFPLENIQEIFNKRKTHLKILNLILYSPEYEKMYKILSMFLKLKEIPHFFYCYDNTIDSSYLIKDDIFYIKGNETFLPGILEKTLYIFNYFKDQEYDYIVRSNISTLINFDFLSNSLQENPIDYGGPLYYMGAPFINPSSGITEEFLKEYGDVSSFCSGICIILSRNAINCILDNKKEALSYNVIDDVALGITINKYLKNGIKRKVNGDVSWQDSKYSPNFMVYRNKSSNRDIDIENMLKTSNFLIDKDIVNKINYNYINARDIKSNFNEHVMTLYNLTHDCTSVLELGNEFTSTWPILKSLSNKKNSTYTAIANIINNSGNIVDIIDFCNFKNINVKYVVENELKIKTDELEKYDLLFIDSIHTYIHVLWQLNSFSSLINKYIILHDTEAPWGLKDEPTDNSNIYPIGYNQDKQGVLTAIMDFLYENHNWKILDKKENNHGLIILGRV